MNDQKCTKKTGFLQILITVIYAIRNHCTFTLYSKLSLTCKTNTNFFLFTMDANSIPYDRIIKNFLNIRTFETNFLVHLRHWNFTENHLLRRNIERYISVLFVTLDIIRINQTSYSWTFPTSTRIYLCPYWNERICSSTLFWQKFEYSSKFGCHIRFNEYLFVWNKKVLVYIQDFWTLFECFCVRLNYSLVSIMHFG